MDVNQTQNQNNTVKIWAIIGITVMSLIAACTVIFTVMFHVLTTGTSTRNIYNIIYSGSNAETAELIADMMGGNVVEVYTNSGSGGTGFVLTYDESGCPIVMTNYHVIDGGQKFYVRTVYETEKYAVECERLGYDEYHDIAILKLPSYRYKDGTFIDLMDTEGEGFAPGSFFAEASYGEYIAAIGNALGGGLGVVDGICSKGSTVMFYDEDKNACKSVPVFQTTAAINKGMSGSPIFNKYGQIVGVGTYKASNADDINFGVPMSIALEVYKDVMAKNFTEETNSQKAKLFNLIDNGNIKYSANVSAVGSGNSIEYYLFNALGYTSASGFNTALHRSLGFSGVLLTGRGNESQGLLDQNIYTGLEIKTSYIDGIKEGDIITEIAGVKLTADYGRLFSAMYTLVPTTTNAKEPITLTVSTKEKVKEVEWKNGNYRVVLK